MVTKWLERETDSPEVDQTETPSLWVKHFQYGWTASPTCPLYGIGSRRLTHTNPVSKHFESLLEVIFHEGGILSPLIRTKPPEVSHESSALTESKLQQISISQIAKPNLSTLEFEEHPIVHMKAHIKKRYPVNVLGRRKASFRLGYKFLVDDLD